MDAGGEREAAVVTSLMYGGHHAQILISIPVGRTWCVSDVSDA